MNEITKATTLSGIHAAFWPRVEFKNAEILREFYVDTNNGRGNEDYADPIKKILHTCKNYNDQTKPLLVVAQPGCGVSTMLQAVKLELEADLDFSDYLVRIIPCDELMLLQQSPNYIDFLLLMWITLIDMVSEYREKTKDWMTSLPWVCCPPESDALFGKFFDEEDLSPENGMNQIRMLLRYRSEYTEQLEAKATDAIVSLIRIIHSIAQSIKDAKLTPVIIFDGLEKLKPADAAKIFDDNLKMMTSVNFPVIYTFPYSAVRDVWSDHFVDQYQAIMFSMIALRNADDTPYPVGHDCLMQIVKKRMETNLIDPDALDLMIEKCGGNIHDLFKMLQIAGLMADDEKHTMIDMDIAKYSINHRRTNMTLYLAGEEMYKFLAELATADGYLKAAVWNPEMLREAMSRGFAYAVFGSTSSFYTVHPLIQDSLKQIGEI